jgi:tetratricopeptide (TPR) repeat protein
VQPGATIDRYVLLDDDAPGGARAAYDPRLDRRVALFVLPAGDEADEQDREDLLDTSRSLAGLSDPHVVAVHDVGTYEGGVFIAMDYVSGRALPDWQDRRTWSEIVDVYTQAARGIAACHAAGLPPGGFTPEAVVIDDADRARLTSISFARTHRDEQDDQRTLCLAAIEALRNASVYAQTPADVRSALERGAADAPENQWPSMSAAVSRLRVPRATTGAGIGTAIAIVGLLAALITWAAWNQSRDDDVEACTAGRGIAAGVWNESRRARIGVAFDTTGVWFATDTWQRVATAIDDHVHTWVTMHRETCLASESGTQSDELLDLTMACLRDRQVQLDYMLRALDAPDAAVVTRAARLPDKLPSLDRCRDARALLAAIPAPSGDAAARVADIRALLARSRALLSTGKLDEAFDIATAALADARDIDYTLARAEAAVLVGEVLILRNKPDEARPAFEQAVTVGLTARDDVLAADSASQLVYVIGFQQADYAGGLWWARQGDAMLDRLRTEDAGLRAGHLMRTAIIYDEMGDPQRAVDTLERALAMAVGIDDQHPSRIAAIRSNLASAYLSLGDIDRTVELQRQVLAHQQSLWGEQHPLVIGTITHLAIAESWRRDQAASLAYYEQALDIATRDPDTYESDIAFVQGNMGGLLVDLGRYEDARDVLERAVATHTRLGRADLPLGSSARLQLGRALAGLGETENAERHLRDGLRLREATYDSGHFKIAYAQGQLGLFLTNHGDRSEALALLESAESTMSRGTDPIDLADIRVSLAAALGGGARARELIAAAIAFFERDPGRYRDLLDRATRVATSVAGPTP